MSRGTLDEPTLAAISKQVPVIDDLRRTVFCLYPDIISVKCAPSSTIPCAAACLQDTLNTLAEARYALYEAIAHKVWYHDVCEPRNEEAAIFFSRFYADDIALRLYSASEHLAESIVNMLEITQQDLAPYEKKRVSRQSIVGHFLRKERSGHPVTMAVLQLATSSEWQQASHYRDEWVHSQPPLIEGLGIVYKRGQRWRISPTGKEHVLDLGCGDEPQYSVEDLLKFVGPALFRFTDVVRSILGFYVDLLKTRGLTLVDGQGLELKLG